MKWKKDDWVIFELEVGQIVEVRNGGEFHDFSDGMFRTSGRLADRFRPITLRNKNIVETMHAIYRRLKDIDGEAGFNYPAIHSHFVNLALEAIDAGDNDRKKAASFDKAAEFVNEARDYKPVIQGVRLFRPK